MKKQYIAIDQYGQTWKNLEQCDELHVMEDGTIGPILPF